jgi:uncharacterized protein YbjQ (UPF0145 family)
LPDCFDWHSFVAGTELKYLTDERVAEAEKIVPGTRPSYTANTESSRAKAIERAAQAAPLALGVHGGLAFAERRMQGVA